MEHSKLPWSYGIGNSCHEIYEKNGACIAETYENIQDSFFIVKACNMHEELMELVKNMADVLDANSDRKFTMVEILGYIEQARAILVKEAE